MATVKTPFRYPGGKSCYAGLLGEIIRLNNYQGCIYCEPFAGGAGAGLSLFFDNKVSRLILNDADPAIYACWWAIVNKTKPFLAKLKQVPVTIQEWHNQRRIYRESHRSDLFTLGFATFFLNRCNRSGILDAGPIGGECQTGSYKIGARFNRKALVGKIEALGDAKNKIEIYNLDAEELICKLMHERSSERLFMYLDPPYYRQGRRLYMNSFSPDDHARYATLLQECNTIPWVLSYDNTKRISSLYQKFPQYIKAIDYSAQTRRRDTELIITQPWLRIRGNLEQIKGRI